MIGLNTGICFYYKSDQIEQQLYGCYQHQKYIVDYSMDKRLCLKN